MPILPAWVQALNIPTEKWNEWTAIHSEPDTLLFWCLTNEQISWSQYIEWAKSHYEMCLLDDAYFQIEDSLSSDTKELLGLAPWTASFQPLDTWDDVLFVACVHPQELIIPSKKVIQVLCSPWRLEARWENIQKYLESTGPKIELPEMPEGMVMDLNPPKVHLNFGDAEETEVPNQPSSHNSHSSPGSHSPSQGNELTVTKGGESMHLTQFNFGPPSDQANTTTESHDFGPISLADAPSDINPDMKEREIVSWLFNQLHPYFELMWWMEFQDEKAVVKWWNPEKKFDPSQLRIDTHTPSFFRIVKKTKLPYHGHIVDSVTHQIFFSPFGDGSLPAHVTAMPIILQSQFKEVFVGSSNQKQPDPQLLMKAEKFLEKALQVLDLQRKPKQKTA